MTEKELEAWDRFSAAADRLHTIWEAYRAADEAERNAMNDAFRAAEDEVTTARREWRSVRMSPLYLLGRVPHAAHEGARVAAHGRLATVAEAIACVLGSWEAAAAYGIRPRQADTPARRAILDRLAAAPRNEQLGDLAERASVQWLARAEARAAERAL